MIPYWFLGLIKLTEESLEMDETGQTLVEYALIIGFVAIVLIGVLTFFGVNLRDIYESFTSAIPNPGSS